MSSDIEIGGTTVLQRSPRVGWLASEDGQAFVHHVGLRQSWLFDRNASLLWQVLDGQSPLAEIADDFADVFTADPAEVLATHRATLLEWWRLGVVVPVEDGRSIEPEWAVGRPRPDPPNR